MRWFFATSVLSLAFGLLSCAPVPALRASSANPDLSVDDGDLDSFVAALDESLRYLESKPLDATLHYGSLNVTTGKLRAALTQVRDAATSWQSVALAVAIHFSLVEASGGKGDGWVLFTGYYEPTLEASLTPSAEFSTPIYALPDDWVEVRLGDFSTKYDNERVIGRLNGHRLQPYASRDDIAKAPLQTAAVLAWARDPVALFFAEVQGSATLALTDGTARRIGYAASNGHPYRSIGKLLIDEGAIAKTEMSMQAIVEWLGAHPQEQGRVLGHNPSKVFFRFIETPPIGALGRPVVSGRSIATDLSLFPPAALGFVETEIAVEASGGVQQKTFRRFVFNHDTGGAIKGAGRADIFFGREGAFVAGHMKAKGKLYFLLPK